ncbi:hypothetical protein NL108_017763 [Boleophthalmus pectinirostris]|nr:hypothetical protein NL108_017763 [Boleophthalmus pectinirostris]
MNGGFSSKTVGFFGDVGKKKTKRREHQSWRRLAAAFSSALAARRRRSVAWLVLISVLGFFFAQTANGKNMRAAAAEVQESRVLDERYHMEGKVLLKTHCGAFPDEGRTLARLRLGVEADL